MSLKSYYAIVPIDNGYVYLCKDIDGLHFLKDKTDDPTDTGLIFNTEVEAGNYIHRYLNKEKYKTEELLLSDNLYLVSSVSGK